MLSLLLFACSGPDPKDSGTEVSTELVVAMLPEAVDFQTVLLGAESTQTFTIQNDGEATVLLADLVPSNDALSVVASAFQVPAHGTSEIAVTWAPSDAGELAAEVVVELGSSMNDLTSMAVAVVGVADGPELVASVSELDFGTVSVGCTARQEVRLQNTGTMPLTIGEIDLTIADELMLTDDAGATLALPLTLASGEEVEVEVAYTPSEEHGVDSVIQVASDAPLTPRLDLPVHAAGLIEDENTLTWEVKGQENVAILFAVNGEMHRMGEHIAGMIDAMPLFFQTLQDAKVDYRVAILMHELGEVSGDVPYIDETLSPEEATLVAAEMLEGTSMAGDNDQQFQTLLAGMQMNYDWLVDDGTWWEDSQLSLVAMNADAEQSPGNATLYLNEYWELKEDDTDLYFHAIGGDPPTGCSGGSAYAAEPYTQPYEAADLTGGVFLSICDDDWETKMETLATAALGESQVFTLTGEPAPSTIEVRVDGATMETGWTYRADLNAITFEEASYPALGSELRVDYVMASACPS